jgi:hypothetical protein
MHDLDFVALSREQSVGYWATRAKTVPTAIWSSAPVMTPVQSPLVGQVSNPQQMAYDRPVVPNSQMFSDQAVWSVPAQSRARQQGPISNRLLSAESHEIQIMHILVKRTYTISLLSIGRIPFEIVLQYGCPSSVNMWTETCFMTNQLVQGMASICT